LLQLLSLSLLLWRLRPRSANALSGLRKARFILRLRKKLLPG
jgi:hypothetical protein